MDTLKEDRLYRINYHQPENILELKWLSGTKEMKDQDFLDTLEVFSDYVMEKNTPFLLIDTHEFYHRFTDVETTMGTRAKTIIPKYLAGGAKKEAFYDPPQAPRRHADYGGFISDSFHSMEDIRQWFAET